MSRAAALGRAFQYREGRVLAGQRHADGRYVPAYRGIHWCSKTRENSQAVRLWKSSCHTTLFRGENHGAGRELVRSNA